MTIKYGSLFFLALGFGVVGSSVLESSSADAQIIRKPIEVNPRTAPSGPVKPRCALNTASLSAPQGGVGAGISIIDNPNGNFKGCQVHVAFAGGKILPAQTTEVAGNDGLDPKRVTQLDFKVPIGPSGAAFLFLVADGGAAPAIAPQGSYPFVVTNPPPVLIAGPQSARVGEAITITTDVIPPGDPPTAYSVSFVFPLYNNKTMPGTALTFLNQKSFTVVPPDPGVFGYGVPATIAQVVLKRGAVSSNALSFQLGPQAAGPAKQKPSGGGGGGGEQPPEGYSVFGPPQCLSLAVDKAVGHTFHKDSEEYFCCAPAPGATGAIRGKCAADKAQYAPDCQFHRNPAISFDRKWGCIVRK